MAVSEDVKRPLEAIDPDRPDRRGESFRAIAIIALALLAGIWVSLGRDLTDEYSPTVDELPHAAAGWAIRAAGDFRVNPEHPPLWKLLSALPHPSDALDRGFNGDLWNRLLTHYDEEWIWATMILYGSDPESGLSYIRRARLPMLLFGLLLGGTLAAWGWKLGGPVAALFTGILFVLEPTLLAHSSLVTSDVPFTALSLLTLFSLAHRSTRRHTHAALTGLLLGLTLATKFSALVFAPIVGALILVRPLLDQITRAPATGNGTSGRPTLSTALHSAAVQLLIVAAVSYATLWATYGFRFSPSPSGELTSVERALELSVYKIALAEGEPGGVTEEIALFAERHRLLPQAYSVGLIWALASTRHKEAFLLGEISSNGWWYYFPVALAVKTSTVTLLALLVALLTSLFGARSLVRLPRWDLACLLIPSATFLAVAMGTSLNIGVRHVLPVIPPLMITAAALLVRAFQGRAARLGMLALILALGGYELISTHPRELSYFNLLSGGSARGIEILGDSNLDWGQDLAHLARWHEENPCSLIHLAYSGTTPPAVYGVEFRPLPARSAAPLPPLQSDRDEVLIVSSRFLQGIDVSPALRPFYELLRRTEPDEILGTTLYVYRLGAREPC